MDHYAAENAGEYLAVVTEQHYSQPSLLRDTEPAIAVFYGASPAISRELSNAVCAPPGYGTESLMSTGLL